jgi:hypothetical protein
MGFNRPSYKVARVPTAARWRVRALNVVLYTKDFSAGGLLSQLRASVNVVAGRYRTVAVGEDDSLHLSKSPRCSLLSNEGNARSGRATEGTPESGSTCTRCF